MFALLKSSVDALIIICLINSLDAFSNFADITCGNKTSQRHGKIVGGMNAGKSEFPWMVSLTRFGGHFCGGTIINNRNILTAAHCFCTGLDIETLNPTHVKVTVSQHDLTQASPDAYIMGVRQIALHPSYICGKPGHDIAIMRLDEEIAWTSAASPACLPEASQERLFDNRIATVAGWGWTNEDSHKGGRAKILQKAEVNVIKSSTCQKWFKSQGKKVKIQDNQMCAGHEQGGIDACWADSGGPLMVDSEKVTMVIGVVSTGIGCARPHLPGIYTRVSEFIPWIQTTIDQ